MLGIVLLVLVALIVVVVVLTFGVRRSSGSARSHSARRRS
jgi:Na+-transporting methylmalonyl-CoA/oxaloacetate decarboxylase gamma subunit